MQARTLSTPWLCCSVPRAVSTIAVGADHISRAASRSCVSGTPVMRSTRDGQYEAVTRRPLAAKVQAAGYRVGLALVLGLMLFATWNDLQKLSLFKFLGGLVS